MAEEHHIANLDPSAFFTLHDFDNDGFWSGDEIRRTYGLNDESSKDVEEARKANVVKVVQEMFDKNGDGLITREEWIEGWMKEGKRLPDFGVGAAIGYCYAYADTIVDTDMVAMERNSDHDAKEVEDNTDGHIRLHCLFYCLEYLLLRGGLLQGVEGMVFAFVLALLVAD